MIIQLWSFFSYDFSNHLLSEMSIEESEPPKLESKTRMLMKAKL